MHTRSHLKSCRTPVHKQDGPLAFDVGDCRVDVVGGHVAPVQQAARHVPAVAWVTLHHLVRWLEARVGDLRHGQLFVVSFLHGNYGSVSDQREVDTWVRNQVCLKFD